MIKDKIKIYFFYAINFSASFLLFQLELIIAKILLPKFGGTYYVWGACIVFFQGILLLGYLYSHLMVRIFGINKYRYFHLALIFSPLLVFPGRSLSVFKLIGGMPLVIEVFWQLLISIGLVFFILSTISLISQSWLSACKLPQQKNPYRLYAVSNMGSFLALFTYPFIFEYNFGIQNQLIFWRLGYFILLIFYFIAFVLIDVEGLEEQKRPFSLRIFPQQIQFNDSLIQKVRWFLYSAASSIIFLSVTNIITSEIAPCPLIWIMPLSMYLFSFVLTFKEKPFCPNWILDKGHLFLGFSVVLFFLTNMQILPITLELIAYFLSLFALCLICQHELYKSRPADKHDLTLFYVILSTGGFLGGLFVTWIAPKVFSFPLEFLVGLWIIALASSLNLKKEAFHWPNIRFIFYLMLTIFLWPLSFNKYNFFGLIILLGVFYLVFSKLKSKPSTIAVALCAFLFFSFFNYKMWSNAGKEIYQFRNYYGINTLKIQNGALFYINGTICHGAQFLNRQNENIPTTYYHLNTPVGKLLSDPSLSLKHIGLIGLGVGTLAAYGREGQVMDFYELDPDIVDMANKFFTFIKNSSAKVNFIIGDARVNLTKSDALYDMLIIDAFSGDSIPAHLLTTDAIREYKKHLVKGGIILFHITNTYLNLYPIILSDAKILNGYALAAWNEGKEGSLFLSSKWAVIIWDENKKNMFESKLGWSEYELSKGIKENRPWTDNYSCILSVLSGKVFIDSLKSYKPFG